MTLYQSSSSSESSDSNFELQRGRKSRSLTRLNFEKNYPKNILISIIASLDITACEFVYEEEGISQQEIQKRNSASLLDIHKILTHPVMKSINKESYQILASNILLQNSKISKKAFHLEILRDIFSFDIDVSFSDFKLSMKKKAQKNSGKDVSGIQIFQYQSSTIYLLTLFCKTLDNNPNLSEESLSNKESTEESFNILLQNEDLLKKKKKSNRQLLKPLIHHLCQRLSRHNWKKQKCQTVYDNMRTLILQTQQKMSEKLNLKRGVPYMRLFCPQVVSKCFIFIQKKQKITFSTLEKWIRLFEKVSLENIAQQICLIKEPIEDFYKGSNTNFHRKKCQKTSSNIKSFCPIVLTPPK